MNGKDLVELIKVPFFDYFYSHVLRISEEYGPKILNVSYRYFMVLIPGDEKFGILKMASNDKYTRIMEQTSIDHPLFMTTLHERGYQRYISGGDPENIDLPKTYLDEYKFLRNIWLSLYRPTFELAVGNRIRFNLKASEMNIPISSSRTATERYNISMNLIPVMIKPKALNNYISFYPRNYGKSPPKFYSVNCSTFRLTSNEELQEIPITIAFNEKDFSNYMGRLDQEFYFFKLASVSSRTFGDLIEPDYNIVLEVLPINPYLLSIHYSTMSKKENPFLIDRLLRRSIELKLLEVIGEDTDYWSNKTIESYGMASIESLDFGIHVRFVKFKVFSKLISLYINGENKSFVESFLKSQDKIRFLNLLYEAMKNKSLFLPTGELIPTSIKTMINDLMREDPLSDSTA
ncbi:hypothetical protein [Thermoplasma acidophilum]|uniref:Uncharacterized protein n=1 Tax=Thermoplasma acidophilum (strain ATCC 25905 / DSM 1728 / JCM 9062 / NBRC 15155 / AMRC-C165) TaxID=273075 RepID=Q9HIE3_THEAC|nr:hypothetical protein [Thermoplasma acidophilum]CAC12517.1 hypothetical protein [Thermoplasma acidophilum]